MFLYAGISQLSPINTNSIALHFFYSTNFCDNSYSLVHLSYLIIPQLILLMHALYLTIPLLCFHSSKIEASHTQLWLIIVFWDTYGLVVLSTSSLKLLHWALYIICIKYLKFFSLYLNLIIQYNLLFIIWILVWQPWFKIPILFKKPGSSTIQLIL